VIGEKYLRRERRNKRVAEGEAVKSSICFLVFVKRGCVFVDIYH